ncbi:MAG: GIY-YIG nuclease family protein [Hyphomicrobiales bacterium]
MEQQKVPTVYILASQPHGTLYIGVTSDLCSRVSLHKQKYLGGFTAKHNVEKLVYFEFFSSMDLAIQREKQMKDWKRIWKIQLVEKMNPQWLDLFAETCGRFDIAN